MFASTASRCLVALLFYAFSVNASPLILSFPRIPHAKRVEPNALASKVSIFTPSQSTHGWNLAADPETTRGSASVVSIAPIDTASSLVLYTPSASSAQSTVSPLTPSNTPTGSSLSRANAVASASAQGAVPSSPSGSASRAMAGLALVMCTTIISVLHSTLL